MSEPHVDEIEKNGGRGRAILLICMLSVVGVVLAFIWRNYGGWALQEINSERALQTSTSDQRLDNLVREVEALKKIVEQVSVVQNRMAHRIAELETRQPRAAFDPTFYNNPAFYYALPARATNLIPQHSSTGTANTTQTRPRPPR